MPVQAVTFAADRWTPGGARNWLQRHGYTPLKRAHRTRGQLRYRIAEPVLGARYATKVLPGGIDLVLMFL